MTNSLTAAVEPALEYVRGVLAGLYPEPVNAMRYLTDDKIRDKALNKIENKIDIFETLEAACEDMLINATRHAEMIETLKGVRDAMSGISDMYTHAWDRVDGDLVMMGRSIELFETRHTELKEQITALTNLIEGENHEPH